MTIIAASIIRKPRANPPHKCHQCGQSITGHKLRLFGCADIDTDRPFVIYLHPTHYFESTFEDPKIIAALKEVA